MTFSTGAFQDKPRDAFTASFPRLAEIAEVCSGRFMARLGTGMHTGIPKCVDNAIVGYMLLKQRAPD